MDYRPIIVIFICLSLIPLISCTVSEGDQNHGLEMDDKTEVPSENEPVITTISAISTTPTTTTTTTQNPEDLKIPVTSTCFYSENELCMEEEGALKAKCNCKLHPLYKNAIFCCNVTDIDKALNCANANLTVLQHLHIQNATVQEIDLSEAKWQLFETVAITDGNISRITKNFAKFALPKCLNLSNNGLNVIFPRVVHSLQYLQLLDISYNNLSSIPNINNQKNLTLSTRGNINMLCKTVNEVLSKESIKFVDPAKTECLTNPKHWFDSPTSISLSQLQRLTILESECPVFEGDRKCVCKVERINFANEEHLVFNARVDCSGLNLLSLPEKLPADTTTLNVSNNSISSLVHFNHETSYSSLENFIADDNEITSMLDLEGSTFVQHFKQLSLRHNKLTSIPIYLLSNTMDRNPQGAEVYLEGNKIKCDCNAAKVLKLWLLAKQSYIKDYEKLECYDGQPVLSLSETKLCRSYVDWTDYIYLIIIVEIVLLVSLICKVTYDYYVFKKHGFLPCPASHIITPNSQFQSFVSWCQARINTRN